VGDDYFPLDARWDVTHKQWRAYRVANGTDWWTGSIRAATRRVRPIRSTLPFGELRPQGEEAVRWNVGCEKCHGPGGAHVNNPNRANIVNPARLDSSPAWTSACSATRRAADPRPIDGTC
jgi:hypothetical protein